MNKQQRHKPEEIILLLREFDSVNLSQESFCQQKQSNKEFLQYIIKEEKLRSKLSPTQKEIDAALFNFSSISAKKPPFFSAIGGLRRVTFVAFIDQKKTNPGLEKVKIALYCRRGNPACEQQGKGLNTKLR